MSKFYVLPFKKSGIKAIFFTILFSVAVFMTQMASTCHAAELQKVDTLFSSNASQVVLQLSESVRYQLHNLPGNDMLPNRCYVDLYSTNLAHTVPSWIGIDKAGLTKIRIGTHATTLRVVLDLKDRNSCTISSSDNPFRLLLTVADTSGTEKKESNFAQTELSEKLKLPIAPQPEPVTTPPEEVDTVFTDLTLTEANRIKPWGWVQLFSAQDTKEQKVEDHHFSRLRSRLGADWETDLNSD